MRHAPIHSCGPFDQAASSDDCPVQPLTLSSVSTRPVRCLWPGRILLGRLTILDGDPGLGKSALLLDLAARPTTARPVPDESDPTSIPVSASPHRRLICRPTRHIHGLVPRKKFPHRSAPTGSTLRTLPRIPDPAPELADC
jgi:hypothetical protein